MNTEFLTPALNTQLININIQWIRQSAFAYMMGGI